MDYSHRATGKCEKYCFSLFLSVTHLDSIDIAENSMLIVSLLKIKIYGVYQSLSRASETSCAKSVITHEFLSHFDLVIFRLPKLRRRQCIRCLFLAFKYRNRRIKQLNDHEFDCAIDERLEISLPVNGFAENCVSC